MATAAGALAACHHEAKPRRPGQEYLKTVDFEGNRDIQDDDLIDGLALHRAQKRGYGADPYQVQVDRERLRGQYVRSGYFGVDVQSRTERVGDATTVTYTIQEGKRAVTKVRVGGLPNDPALKPEDIRAKFPLRDGQPFDYDVYDAAKTPVLGVVQDAGYAHAKLDAHVTGDLATNTAVVDLNFQPGKKCRFGKVEVTGIDGDLRDSVLARLHFKEGDVYSNAAVTATQRDLYGMGRFSTVQVAPATEDENADVLDMKVAVVDGAPRQVTLGAGFGVDPIAITVRGRAGFQYAGFPTQMDTLTLDLRPAYAYLRDGSGYEPRMRALAQIDRADLFMTHATGTVSIAYNYLAYEAFTEYGPEGTLGYDFRLGSRHLKAHLGYRFHRYGFRRPSPLLDEATVMELGIDHPEQVGAFEQSIIADFRNHPIEPTLGIYGEFKIVEGTEFAGGQYTYQQIVPELRGYVPLPGNIVLASRARYGQFLNGDAPPTERFFGGGATSMRGFGERALSPSVTGMVDGATYTVPYGGEALLEANAELRFPLTTIKKMPLNGVMFVDAGDVTSQASQMDLGNLHYAAGIGMRLVTVIGPVRADFARRLNRIGGPDDPDPGSTFAFHLSLGEAF